MKTLPIDQAPKQQALRLPPDDLHALNELLLTAQLRASEARELEARLVLARQEAQRAAQEFAARRASVSEVLGVRLGETHGWDRVTGAVREVPQP